MSFQRLSNNVMSITVPVTAKNCQFTPIQLVNSFFFPKIVKIQTRVKKTLKNFSHEWEPLALKIENFPLLNELLKFTVKLKLLIILI